jgi:hypothetical protein
MKGAKKTKRVYECDRVVRYRYERGPNVNQSLSELGGLHVFVGDPMQAEISVGLRVYLQRLKHFENSLSSIKTYRFRLHDLF